MNPPFPGLRIGALTVKRVYVNQGANNDEISVQFRPVNRKHARILLTQGFTTEGDFEKE